MSRELLKQCLDLITQLDKEGLILESGLIFALRDELAKPEQEPVCNKDPHLCGFVQCQLGKVCKHTEQLEKQPYCWVQSKLNQGMFYKEKPRRIHTIPLYTAPHKRKWVGLTEGELIDIKDCNRGFWINAAKIEQLLKDKNT